MFSSHARSSRGKKHHSPEDVLSFGARFVLAKIDVGNRAPVAGAQARNKVLELTGPVELRGIVDRLGLEVVEDPPASSPQVVQVPRLATAWKPS
jgi:hypothetical protein